MQTDPDKLVTGNRESARKKTRWTRRIQRKAFLIGYSPSLIISRTWRCTCPHIPLRETSDSEGSTKVVTQSEARYLYSLPRKTDFATYAWRAKLRGF